MYEECQRMPLLVRYPPKIKAGTTSKALTMNVDFAPTLLDMAGIKVPPEIQGKSIQPILINDGKAPLDWRKSVYYHYYEYPSWHMVKRHYGIRTERYKLIHFYNDVDEWEMYDLKQDPNELNNLYGKPEYNKIQKELIKELAKQQAYYKDLDPNEKKFEFFHGSDANMH